MLEQLFGSKTRTKLLRLFLLNPDEAFFIRELTRKIDTQINSVRRELQNLYECDILEVVQVQPSGEAIAEPREVTLTKPESRKDSLVATQARKFFRMNKNFVLFNELKLLFLKSPLLFQNELIRELKNIGTIDFAALTGFFVDREDISVDLLIVGEAPKTKLLKLINAFEKEFEREINYTTMTTEEFLYRKSLTDRFLFQILEGKKIVIINKLPAPNV
ncbi:hypothetical protein HY620_02620 [Candidatus Uhrbacteria bacterium]|nr:hypothetical protein [Candidatus Uhrbacteria bacterium]